MQYGTYICHKILSPLVSDPDLRDTVLYGKKIFYIALQIHKRHKCLILSHPHCFKQIWLETVTLTLIIFNKALTVCILCKT